MKKTFILLLLAVFVALLAMTADQKHSSQPQLSVPLKEISNLYKRNVASLDSFLMVYPRYFYDSSYVLRNQKYKELAYRVKLVSGPLTFFEPATYYRHIAGPFHFVKSDRKGIFGQVQDAFLFSGPTGIDLTDEQVNTTSAEELAEEKDFISDATKNYRKTFQGVNFDQYFNATDGSELFRLLRTEIFRISTVDMGNADFVIDTAALAGLRGSLQGWGQLTGEIVKILPPAQNGLKSGWNPLFTDAISYLEQHTDFAGFDRMFFTRHYLIPLSAYLYDLQVATGVPFSGKRAAIRADAKHIYDIDAISVDFFTPDEQGYYSADKAYLGEMLFFDPILSGNNKRACASCHKPELAFSDGRKKGLSFSFDELPRNTPTIINSGFQKQLFWDERAQSLEEQMDTVLNSAMEMHSSFPEALQKLAASPDYVKLFKKAFPGSANSLTKENIRTALAVYQRSLTALNSRFDRYMRGDESALGKDEIGGFNIFMGKGRCGVCHFAPLFNGTVPPFYKATDHHSDGVTLEDSMKKYKIDPDKGVFLHSGKVFDQFSFKTPTVRNIELTAPYMHNGIYPTLERVVDFYNDAAGAHFIKDTHAELNAAGLPRISLTILPLKLELTPAEKKELVAFLNALTDTGGFKKRPPRLPVIAGKFKSLNKRKIGGDY